MSLIINNINFLMLNKRKIKVRCSSKKKKMPDAIWLWIVAWLTSGNKENRLLLNYICDEELMSSCNIEHHRMLDLKRL